MKNLKIEEFSHSFYIRKIEYSDIDSVLQLCLGNTEYYDCCKTRVCEESVKEAMQALPPGKTYEDKYYIGYFLNNNLTAVMDFIDGYPDDKTAFIGFFMVDAGCQNKGVGSQIISQLLCQLKALGFCEVRLGCIKDNLKAKRFWLKNGFVETGKVSRNDLYEVEVLSVTIK